MSGAEALVTWCAASTTLAISAQTATSLANHSNARSVAFEINNYLPDCCLKYMGSRVTYGRLKICPDVITRPLTPTTVLAEKTGWGWAGTTGVMQFSILKQDGKKDGEDSGLPVLSLFWDNPYAGTNRGCIEFYGMALTEDNVKRWDSGHRFYDWCMLNVQGGEVQTFSKNGLSVSLAVAQAEQSVYKVDIRSTTSPVAVAVAFEVHNRLSGYRLVWKKDYVTCGRLSVNPTLITCPLETNTFVAEKASWDRAGTTGMVHFEVQTEDGKASPFEDVCLYWDNRLGGTKRGCIAWVGQSGTGLHDVNDWEEGKKGVDPSYTTVEGGHKKVSTKLGLSVSLEVDTDERAVYRVELQ